MLMLMIKTMVKWLRRRWIYCWWWWRCCCYCCCCWWLWWWWWWWRWWWYLSSAKCSGNAISVSGLQNFERYIFITFAALHYKCNLICQNLLGFTAWYVYIDVCFGTNRCMCIYDNTQGMQYIFLEWMLTAILIRKLAKGCLLQCKQVT